MSGGVDRDDRNAAGGSREIPDAGAGTSGTSGAGFSGTAGVANGGMSGVPNGGAAPMGGAAGRPGSGGAGVVGGAGQGGSAGQTGGAGQAGSAGQAGNPTVIDRGVVTVWSNNRWLVATPTNDSRALVLYEVSDAGVLLAEPREVELDDAPVPLRLADAALDPSTGELGIIGDRAFVSVSEGLESATLGASLGPSDCFLPRIEHVLELFVFVSVRQTFEGTSAVLETPGVIDGNPGFYQKDLTGFQRNDCRSLAFSSWLNPAGSLGVDFIYPLRTLETAPLSGYRLYDRSQSGFGVATLTSSSGPFTPDFTAQTRLDFVRAGARSVASFRDSLQNGTRYLLLDEFAFTVLDDTVQHATLRLAAPMKGDEQGFTQAVVVDDSPPRLELRTLWTNGAVYGSNTLASGEIIAVHLAQGPEGTFAVAFRVGATPPRTTVGALPPGLYLFGVAQDQQRFRTDLPDL